VRTFELSAICFFIFVIPNTLNVFVAEIIKNKFTQNSLISSQAELMPIAQISRQRAFEDWLSVDESGLGLLAKAAHYGSPDILPSDAKFIVRAIRACIALGCRSAYGFYMISQIPGLAEMLEVDTGHQALITMSLRVMRKKFEQFSNWDFAVLYNLSENLLINEQPFRDWTLRSIPAVTMPLAPRALLYGQPPKQARSSQMSLAWVSASDRRSVVEQQNKIVIETARQWVVGANANAISNISLDLYEDRLKQRRASDRYVML
jgi:hypothetical protein